MKCFAVLALLVAAASALPAVAAPPAKKPKLVLTLVIDQFRYDYLTRFRARYNSGLAQLLDKGAVFTNAHYEQVPTVTAVGHSIVLTGAMPALSGIVGNEWYDRDTGKQVTSVSDTTVKTLGAPERTGASPRKLLVSTVGDELKLAAGSPSKVIGISIKDRSAILPAGSGADAAYWFDADSGNFVSSTYYFNDLPTWVNEFNRQRVPDQYAGKDWLPLGGGSALKKMPVKVGKELNDAVVASAFGNDMLAAFAERAIVNEKMGQNGGTDLLSISFSSNDSVGHKVGPHDPQVEDISVRTDRVIGHLFEVLEKNVGMENVVVVLTADHGVAPMPEEMAKRHMIGGRIPEATVLDAVEKALNEKFGEENWVIGKSGPAPYLDHKLIANKKLDLEEVQKVAAATLRGLPYIARVYLREDLRKGLALNDQTSRRVQNGFFYQRASDLVVIAKPYFLFEKSGTSHGTPYNYDSHVPVILMGRGIKAGRYLQRAVVNDIAPTLATYLEIETPSGSSGRVLEEIFETK